VRATEARFIEFLDRMLPEFILPDISEEWIFSADCGVEKKMAGGKIARGIARLYVGGLKIFEGRDQEEMGGRLLSAIRDLATDQSNEFVRCRAGGVAVNGTGLLLPSAPEPQLPALVALLLRSGARYIGDELVSIDPILGRMHGLKMPLLIDAADLVHFPELGRAANTRRPRGTRAQVEGKTPRTPVRVDELGAEVSGPAPVGRIVFPSFSPGARTEFQAVGRAEAVFGFTQSILNLHLWRERTFPFIEALLNGATVSRLVVGSLAEAARLLLDDIDG